MENLQLAERTQEIKYTTFQQDIDYAALRLEMNRIQAEIMKDVSKQKRAFVSSNFKLISYSVVFYAGVVLFAWSKYHR